MQAGGHIRKKLDKCLVDSDWCLMFPHALLELLPMHNSGHNPLASQLFKRQKQED